MHVIFAHSFSCCRASSPPASPTSQSTISASRRMSMSPRRAKHIKLFGASLTDVMERDPDLGCAGRLPRVIPMLMHAVLVYTHIRLAQHTHNLHTHKHEHTRNVDTHTHTHTPSARRHTKYYNSQSATLTTTHAPDKTDNNKTT